MVQCEIKVTGRVQGVGFRYYIRSQANKLNLKGWVRNTVDGGVLTVVQGSEHAINTLVEYLWIGTPLSHVKSVLKIELPLIEEYSDFEVRL